MSKLLTDKQLQTIPNLYETENQKDPICHIKLFLPSSNWTWYIIELDEAVENFKEEQSYLLEKNYDKVIAIQTVSSAIINLKLKGDK